VKPYLLKKIDLEPDTVSFFNGMADMPGSVLLDSGMIMEGLSRYSFISTDPFMTFTSRKDRVSIETRHGPRAGETSIKIGNPFNILNDLMKQYKMEGVECPVPFFGGAVGFFSYDMSRQLEKIPEKAADDIGVEDCWLGFYDVVAALDHVSGSVYLISTGQPEQDAVKKERRAAERLDWLENQIRKSIKINEKTETIKEISGGSSDYLQPAMISDFDKESYCRVVERAREYIAAGDIFQVNLSQRFSLPARDRPWDVYHRLRKINPAPMAAYINCGHLQVVSASPERFLRVTGDMVETRPIKGTRPRGKNPLEDSMLREELWNSEKDRAELVMIVDLERNDLGRVCVPGTVHVPELYRLEDFPTVFHLVSTVVGRLEGCGITELLKASFPGGSITGAPKIRAMEIIEELEPVRRGIYCGSIGYLGFNGDADLNIVIRTLLFTPERIYFQVGGGLTIDSHPESEYSETLDKAKALIKALLEAPG